MLFDVRGIYNWGESNLCLSCLLCELAGPESLMEPERSFGDIEIEGRGKRENPMLETNWHPKFKKILDDHFSEHVL